MQSQGIEADLASMLKELTVKGVKREAVIGSLLRRGVCDLEQNTVMDNLANKIFSSLWDRIESSVQSGQGKDGSLFSSLQGRYLTIFCVYLLIKVSIRLALPTRHSGFQASK